MWTSLPQGLHSLACPSSSCVPTSNKKWKTHTGLRKLQLTGGQVGIQLLVGLLAVAPDVDSIHLSNSHRVDVKGSGADAQALQTFAQRMAAGLAISGPREDETRLPASLHWPGLLFCILFCRTSAMSNSLDHTMSEFMAILAEQPLLGITEVEFNVTEDMLAANTLLAKQPGDMSRPSRVFPDIRSLHVNNMDLFSWDLQALLGCLSLHQISLVNVQGLSPEALLELCIPSKCLRNLELRGCRVVSRQDFQNVQACEGMLAGVRVCIE